MSSAAFPHAALHSVGALEGRPDRPPHCCSLILLPNAAGVEFAGTLSDFLREDLNKKYPELMQYVRVSLLNATPSILVQFEEK